MSYKASLKKDLQQIAFLFAAAFIIYYPVFYTEYAYTDELVGLWQWNTGKADSAATLFQYGRYITAKLAGWLFGSASFIRDLTLLRMVSFFGWLLCIPVWYYVLKRIVRKENLPEVLCFFSVLYLICTPSFTISVGWAACFELFIANTAGLLSGYFLYTGIHYENNHIKVSPAFFLLSLIAGLVSLFTYQNCFGFFLLPFLLHFINKAKFSREVIIGITVYFIIYTVYYLLFKYSLKVSHVSTSERTGIHINVGNKLPYFLLRPMSSAFQFTSLFNEKSIAGFVVYALVAGVWLLCSFYQMKKTSLAAKGKYYVAIFCLLGLIFLPSLVVKENYASNRTLFALRLAVFVIVAHTLLISITKNRTRAAMVVILSLFFCANAWYNFNRQFLNPLKHEYEQLKNFIATNYKSGTDTIYFIRPPEDFFVKQYGITRSWDEFGVPSTFFEWTPAFLVKQIVFEKTGKREVAEKLIIKNWPGRVAYSQYTDTSASQNTLVVDTEKILTASGQNQ